MVSRGNVYLPPLHVYICHGIILQSQTLIASWSWSWNCGGRCPASTPPRVGTLWTDLLACYDLDGSVLCWNCLVSLLLAAVCEIGKYFWGSHWLSCPFTVVHGSRILDPLSLCQDVISFLYVELRYCPTFALWFDIWNQTHAVSDRTDSRYTVEKLKYSR